MRQRLGQHFLNNKSVLAKIAKSIEARPEENIIEIGPGHGELTDCVIADKKEGTGKILLIERDSELAAALREKYKENNSIEIHEGNALKILPQLVESYALRTTHYALIGNLPYYLTGYLIRLIGGLEHKPRRSVFTIQKEVAERAVAMPPDMNRLAAAIRGWANPKIIGLISRKDFSPPPEVDSATVIFETKEDAPKREAAKDYEAALSALFKQPRKTIANNLIDAAALSRDEAATVLKKARVSPDLRPQNLRIEDIMAIGKELRMGDG